MSAKSENGKQGVVRIIKDLVIYVEFEKELPKIGELVIVESKQRGLLLVDSLAAGNMAICLNIQTDRTIEKNMAVSITGHGIEIPVGKPTVGRIFDALGQPLDGQPPVDASTARRNILTLPPRSTSFTAAKPEILDYLLYGPERIRRIKMKIMFEHKLLQICKDLLRTQHLSF
jgi:F-type H+-transporting ATPase subunit beta